jgi:hypothetical protein
MTAEKHMLSDYSKELRDYYLGASPHTLFTGLVWLASAWWAESYSKTQAIGLFIIVGTFTYPAGELIRKMMRVSTNLSKENRLPQMFMLLAFTIPLSYPLIYLVCRENINLFFPAFTILIGAHYLPFVFGYKMKSFAILSILLVGLGTVISLKYPSAFSLSGYLTGSVLVAFAALHFTLIKKQLV